MLRVKEIAKSKGITITELAEKLGVTQVTLSRTLSGNPTLNTLIKIASILGVDVRDLIEPTQESTTKALYIKDNEGNLLEVGQLKNEVLE